MRAALLAIGLLTACTAQVGVHDSIDVPSDAAATCAQQCDSVGLRFDGVAMVGVTVACICAPQDAAPSARRAAGATAAAAAASDDDDPPSPR